MKSSTPLNSRYNLREANISNLVEVAQFVLSPPAPDSTGAHLALTIRQALLLQGVDNAFEDFLLRPRFSQALIRPPSTLRSNISTPSFVTRSCSSVSARS